MKLIPCELADLHGQMQLIMAGIVTDVCIAFPALAALAEGFEVYIVVDCSGTFNQAVRAQLNFSTQLNFSAFR